MPNSWSRRISRAALFLAFAGVIVQAVWGLAERRPQAAGGVSAVQDRRQLMLVRWTRLLLENRAARRGRPLPRREERPRGLAPALMLAAADPLAAPVASLPPAGVAPLAAPAAALPPAGLAPVPAVEPEAGPQPPATAAAASREAAPAPVDPAPLRAAPSSRPRLTPRRDPLEVPLREGERWQEWLVSVEINGARIAEGAYVIRDPETGRFAVPLEELRKWRLRARRSAVLTFQGMPFYPLDAVEGLRAHFDATELLLALEVPPAAFEPFVLERERKKLPPPAVSWGAFADYDLDLTLGEGVSDRFGGLFDFGLFGPPGVLHASLLLEDVPEDPELIRLETTFVRDFPDRRTTLRVGDSFTVGGAFAGSERFFGIQYGTNFATDPRFVTFPLPVIGGLAEQQSVVELVVDNIERMSGEVPPGPFSIPNVPVVTGAGEVQLRIRDLLGRERLITQSYYVSPRLLRRGLHDFSYETGFLREQYGARSFDYGDPFLSLTHRYGFTDWATGEVHGELVPGRASLAAGGTLRVGTWGVLFGGLGVSRDEDAGTGLLAQIGYEYLGRRFDLSLRTRYTSPDFRQFGEEESLRRVDEASLGFDLAGFGRLGLSLLHQEREDAADSLSASLSLSVPLGPGSLILSGARLFEPDEDFAVTLHYALPLEGQRTVSGGVEASDRRTRARLQFRQGRGASDLGLDYRIATELGEDPRPLDVRASYQGRLGTVEGALELADGDPRLRLGTNGTVTWLAGHLGLTRRVGRAFGLVELPGLPGVRVYLENTLVGTTDENGVLFIPGLRPYEANRVRLELSDLPLGVVVDNPEVVAVPYDREGVRIDFGLHRERRATARLLLADGSPLPAGIMLRDAEGETEVLVARDGLAQIRGLPERQQVGVSGKSADVHYFCLIPPFAGTDPLPDLGVIRCQERTSGS